ncbi:MAG: hypothetical protein U0795_26280 [Pirellulales bacterium]
MTVGVSMGVFGAASAYFVPIDAPDATILGLTLNDDAGVKLDEKSQLQPVATRGQQLDAPTLAALRATTSGIPGRTAAWRYVRVKEFSWSRWPGKWLTVVGAALLVIGAMIARSQRQRQASLPDDGSVVPLNANNVSQLAAEIDQLLSQSAAPGTDVRRTVCDVTDRLQKKWITPLFRARETLVREHGIGRAAEPLASLAAVERNLYRAWSASTDGYPNESITALRTARRQCELTQQLLQEMGAT